MRAAVVNLGSPLNRKDEQAGVRVDDCTALALRFETLAIVGVLEAREGRLAADTLRAAADALDQPIDASREGGVPWAEPAEFVRLARWVAGSSDEFLPTYAALIRPPY